MRHATWLSDSTIQCIGHRRITALYMKFRIIPDDMLLEGVTIESPFVPINYGGNANIYTAMYQGKAVGLKELRMPWKHLELFCREALVWKNLCHQNIHELLGVTAEVKPGFYFMVTPWISKGTLKECIGSYPEGFLDLRSLVIEIAEGLKFLHDQDVVHGDLRGDNIFISDDDHILISDFGLCRFTDADPVKTGHRGSIRWMPPELQVHDSSFKRTTGTDVFSFASVCVEIYTKQEPFPSFGEGAVSRMVQDGSRPPRSSNIDDVLWRIMEWCWSHAARDRPPISTVLNALQGNPLALSVHP